uniref:DDE_Tnp_IS1595 domain-containing protein n=1 Tax=Strongyloides venezuelensis TaxID=75913 RepID=A0A0K0F3A6_STRVS
MIKPNPDIIERVFLLKEGSIYLSSKNCPKCGNSMSLNSQSLRCGKKTCRAKVTVRDGTFFSKMKAPLNVILFYLYYFIFNTRQNQTEMYLKIISATNAALHKYFRQLIANAVNESDVKIRCHRVEGAWVLDGVESTSERKLFVRVVESRNAETLLPIIQQHFLPETTIRTKCWRGYARLGQLDYIHETVNHFLQFRDSETDVHTNTIEITWLGIKLKIPLRCRHREVIDDYLLIRPINKFYCINKGRRLEAPIWALKNIQRRDLDPNTVPMDKTFGLLAIEDGPGSIDENLEAGD